MMKTLFGLTAALALGAGVLAIAPSTAEANHGWYGYQYGHFPRVHRPFFGAYAYAPFAYGSCWRVRYTPWGPQRVWVCGPRYPHPY